MTFKPAVWYPIAVALSAINLIAVGFAVMPGEPWHAATHAALALGFWTWAQRLRQGVGGADLQGRLEALEIDVSNMRRELGEAHERLDFAERLLAQAQESRRVGPER